MPEIGSILQGAAGLAGLVVNPIMQHQQNQWNAQQMAQQNQWNIEQWRRETEYNSPVNQMARLRAAGINPALAFTQGGLVNEAAASPAMQASQGKAPQVDTSSMVGLAGLDLQSKLIDAQSDLAKAQAENIIAKQPKELKMLDATIDQLSSSARYNEQLVEQSKSYTKVLGEEYQKCFIENEYLAQTLDSRVKQCKAEGQIKATEASYIADNLQAQIANLRESTRLMRSNRFLNSQMGAHYAAIDRHLSYANRQLEAMTDYIAAKKGNIPVENTIGFISAGANAIGQANKAVFEWLTFGKKGKGPNVDLGPNTSEPDYPAMHGW